MTTLIVILIAAVLVAAVVSGISTDPVDTATVSKFDVARYMGTWYEIARYDNRFECGLSRVEARYRLQADGCIEVENSGLDEQSGLRRRKLGKAHATRTPGRLRVSFFWIFYSDYRVLELGDGYDWALVGGGSQKYLWILSRTPTLPGPTLEYILQLARQRGYDTDMLVFVEQE